MVSSGSRVFQWSVEERGSCRGYLSRICILGVGVMCVHPGLYPPGVCFDMVARCEQGFQAALVFGVMARGPRCFSIGLGCVHFVWSGNCDG